MKKPRKSIAELEQENCSNRHNHMESPSDYVEWHDWAERMAKTHKQIKCPECGYWVIWVRK